MKNLKLVAKENGKGKIVKIEGPKNTFKFDDTSFMMIAGPCAVESEEQLMTAAKHLSKQGVKFLRGGAFKPRSNPYSFQGMEEDGLKILAKARKETSMIIVTEVMDESNIKLISKYADVLQVGARNAQNFSLLKQLGKQKKPIILKRGMSMTIEEWLASAEYIMKEGNENVILCERGIRTFETETRNTLDLSAIPAVKKHSWLPIIVDPTHATGVKDYILPMSKAAIAAGCDGLMVEVHPNPSEAKCDGMQSMNLKEFDEYYKEIKKYLKVEKRK